MYSSVSLKLFDKQAQSKFSWNSLFKIWFQLDLDKKNIVNKGGEVSYNSIYAAGTVYSRLRAGLLFSKKSRNFFS